MRNGTGHVVRLWLVRWSGHFPERDNSLFRMLGPALERLLRERPTSGPVPALTTQERRVLQLVAIGLSNAEVGARLFVAPATVRKHLENAYRKLGVTIRLAAVFALDGAGPGGP